MRGDWNSGIVEYWSIGKDRLSNLWKTSSPKTHHSSFIPHRSSLGLTLIEVLLAVVILGIGSGVLMLATARCLSVVTKARRYSTAQRLVLQVGAENPLTRGEIEAGTDSGDFDDGYNWEREITESEDENREGLYTVRTRVSWSARGKEQFEEIVTWHYVEPEENNL